MASGPSTLGAPSAQPTSNIRRYSVSTWRSVSAARSAGASANVVRQK
jgi:hypothetical protein